jgi:hypothetical protein
MCIYIILSLFKINQLNIDLQKSEKELQNQLILSIPHNQYQSMTKRLNELEQSEHTLQTQVDYQQVNVVWIKYLNISENVGNCRMSTRIYATIE